MSKNQPVFNKTDRSILLLLSSMIVVIIFGVAVFDTSYYDSYGYYHPNGGPVYLWQVAVLLLGVVGLVTGFFKLWMSAQR